MLPTKSVAPSTIPPTSGNSGRFGSSGIAGISGNSGSSGIGGSSNEGTFGILGKPFFLCLGFSSQLSFF